MGAPHEFKYNKYTYTGDLEHPVRLFNRFHGETIFPIGSVTDDTVMTFTLANQIVSDQGYNEDNIILAYERWANSTKMLGKNTRQLFKGVSTVKGFRGRWHKKFDLPIEEWTQSNGSLMRCSPFVIFKDYHEIIKDAKL
ncbi:MAG TPA: ADP-ribosylglycohydrolase family protein, partial [Aquella sp.]|nr:ADP-ribosylglycohydrolase family protein [Aquella sp.]